MNATEEFVTHRMETPEKISKKVREMRQQMKTEPSKMRNESSPYAQGITF